MDKGNLFFLVFILTILAVRAFVFLFPARKMILFGAIIHHFWTGLAIVLIALLLRNFESSWILFAVGLGLIADELAYMILGAGPVSNYWNAYSLAGAVLNSVIVFMLRNRIIGKI